MKSPNPCWTELVVDVPTWIDWLFVSLLQPFTAITATIVTMRRLCDVPRQLQESEVLQPGSGLRVRVFQTNYCHGCWHYCGLEV